MTQKPSYKEVTAKLKALEHELALCKKQAEEKFELSMHNSLIGCYIVQGSKFRYVNPEFTRITGYSEDALIDTVSLNIVQPEYRCHVKANAIRMVKGERDYPYEFCITDKYGNIKWILETATSIIYKGKRATLGYFMDISKSKQVEQERLEKEKLISILEMAGAVGHELNNPLQVVVTCIKNLSPEPDDGQRNFEYYNLLKRSIDKIKKTVGKFQNITRYATKDYVQGKKIIDIDAASQDETG
jgi:PAS domain S-box-containing protein